MNRGAVFFLTLCALALVFTQITLAQEERKVVISFLDAFTGAQLKEFIAIIKLYNPETEKTLKITQYSSRGEITLFMHDQDIAEFTLDLPETEGWDFFAKREAQALTARETLEVLPIGTLNLVVVDALENRIPLANITVACTKEYGLSYPAAIDRYGSATFSIPAGACTIEVVSKKEIASRKIEIRQGERKELQIELSQGASFFSLVGILLLVIAGGSLLWKNRHLLAAKKKENIPTTTVPVTNEPTLSARAEAVLKILNGREKQIVQFLLVNDHQSLQSKIRHETKIPKTSLARVLTSLQQKGIVTLDPHGIVKRVKLTSWFLEKEK